MKKTISILIFAYIFCANDHLFAQNKKQVLFIGNSYTAGNNLPQMVYDVAFSAGDTLVFDSHTPGGMTFQGHSSNATTIAKIQSGNWDFVVLQEQSQRPAFPLSQVQVEVFPYATLLDSIINVHNSCGETMFFMTWGRKNGDAGNCQVWPPVCTYEGMDSLLHLRYMMMAQMNDAVVSPVGTVWRYLRTYHPTIELYQADESHPSMAGSYAAAVCFYSSIFGKDPSSITYNSSLNAADALIIRNAVKTLVFDSLSNWFFGTYQPVPDFSYNILNYSVQFQNLSAHASQFEWDFGDGNLSTDENPIHVYSADGTYIVSLTASHCGNSDVLSDTIVVTGVGLKENELNAFINIFPNPATESIYIESNVSLDGLQYKLFDITGRLVFQDKFSNNVNAVSIKHLSVGMYFLEIPKVNTAPKTWKIIKQ